VGLDRAVLNPDNPLLGELIELQMDSAAASVQDLVSALSAQKIIVNRFGTDPDGATNLVLTDRLGRARSEAVGSQTFWWVVLVGRDHAHHLDPDALLKSIAPPPESVAWGDKQAMSGGSDGSPWGEVAEANQPTGGWVSQIEVDAWSQDPRVVGVWEGASAVRGTSVKLRFRFENTGLLQVQRTDQAGAAVIEGQWATRGTLMQMDIDGGGSNLPYHVTQRTLSVSWRGASVSLYPLK